jgi:hypothetical protein
VRFATLGSAWWRRKSMARTKWRIDGHRGLVPTGFSREVVATENQIECVFERLAARHLTEDEIVDATLGSGTHFEIIRDKRPGKPMQLSTRGTGHHYVAVELRDRDSEAIPCRP